VIENRDAWEQRALSDDYSTYHACSRLQFGIPIVKTPTKAKITNIKQNNVQAFVNFHIRPIILLRR